MPRWQARLRRACWIIFVCGFGILALWEINLGVFAPWWSQSMVPYSEVIPAYPMHLTIPRGLGARVIRSTWCILVAVPCMIVLTSGTPTFRRVRRRIPKVLETGLLWLYTQVVTIVILTIAVVSILQIGALPQGVAILMVGGTLILLGLRVEMVEAR